MIRHCFYIAFIGCLFFGCGAGTPTSDTSTSAPTPLEVINTKLRTGTDNPDLFMERSKIHLDSGETAMPLADVNRCIALDSLNAAYHVFKGEVLFHMEQFSKAIVSYEKSINIDPENPDGYARLGEMKLYLRQYQEALNHVNKSLKLDQMKYYPYYVKGWIFLETGDTAKAVGSLRTSIELNPDFYDGYILLGKLYSGAGKELAVEYFTSAYELDATNSEPLFQIGYHYQINDEPEKAIEWYRKSTQINSGHPFSWFNAGYVWLNSFEELDSAFQCFAKAAYVEPQYADAFYNMGFCRELMGQPRAALDYYRKTLAVNPNHDLAISGVNRLE